MKEREENVKKISKIIFLALACAIINGNSISAYAENLIEKSVQTETISIETEIAEIAETEETIENGQGMIDGFVTEGNKTYYYYAGEKLTGHQEIEGKRYYFDVATGAMFKGERVESGHWVYYSEVDGTLATGWTEHKGKGY